MVYINIEAVHQRCFSKKVFFKKEVLQRRCSTKMQQIQRIKTTLLKKCNPWKLHCIFISREKFLKTSEPPFPWIWLGVHTMQYPMHYASTCFRHFFWSGNNRILACKLHLSQLVKGIVPSISKPIPPYRMICHISKTPSISTTPIYIHYLHLYIDNLL